MTIRASNLTHSQGLSQRSVTRSSSGIEPDRAGPAGEAFVWSRRRWLTSHTLGLAALIPSGIPRRSGSKWWPATSEAQRATLARQGEFADVTSWEGLAQRAVETAHAAGARYADARVTRLVRQKYHVNPTCLGDIVEYVGVGVRALVGGAWGFSASALITSDEVVRLAQNAVGQAKEAATGLSWPVDLGTIPVARGRWTTPVRIDPFKVSIEEKFDFIADWRRCATRAGLIGPYSWLPDELSFVRQERVVATSEGALFTQTLYESGGSIPVLIAPPDGSSKEQYVANRLGLAGGTTAYVHGIAWAGAGWELFLDARIDEQFNSGQITQEIMDKAAIASRPSTIGKYTIVCDGATMAALVEATLGRATQLDRALGYEANAGGTSFLDDPLGMVGTATVAAPMVTLLANRSAPGQLATVKWDEEGVVPEPFPLVKEGVLMDFQTTREQAAWLAPYYQRHGRPVTSHGCAMAESAHCVPLQQLPNLAMEPNSSTLGLDDLVRDVSTGILIESGTIDKSDWQGRTGLLLAGGDYGGQMREIKNGRLGKILTQGAVSFNSPELWKGITTIGGSSTQGRLDFAANQSVYGWWMLLPNTQRNMKGEPPQLTSHSIRAVAATIPNQAVINPMRKA